MNQELVTAVQRAITDLDRDLLMSLTDSIQAKGIDPVEAVQEGYTPGIKAIGEMFERGDIFLPELVQAGQMVKEAVERLQANIPKAERKSKGKFLMGTVEGDIHNIGKDLVITMLVNQGIDVVDIGVDVPAAKFVERALEEDADIIGASCLLTMTAPELKKIMGELERRGVRDRFKVMFGGAAVSPSYVRELGADGTGTDLKEAVDVALKLLEEKSLNGGSSRGTEGAR